MACSAMNARCSGCGFSSFPSPSMVTISLPAMDHSGVSQEATARSPTMTLQAPHSLAPHPKCGPVMPSRPRKISRSEESGSASTSVSTPLRRNRMLGIVGSSLLFKHDLFGKPVPTFPDHALLRPVAELLDDVGPFHNIVPEKFVELFPRHRHRSRALFGPKLDDFRSPDRGVHGGTQFVEDRLWRFGRRHQSEPDRRLITGDAGFRDRRHLRQNAGTRRAGGGERAHLFFGDG